MIQQLPPIPAAYADFLIRLLTDLVAIFIFAIGIYFRRHARKDLAVVFAFFNIGLFVVITSISNSEAAAAIGFGLFAMLSIIRLRSEPFRNRELGYFFGALVLGMVNGIGAQEYPMILALNGLILASIYVLDHPGVLKTGQRRRITLDAIYSDREVLLATLESRLDARIVECTVVTVDYVRDVMELEVQSVEHPPTRAIAQTKVPEGSR